MSALIERRAANTGSVGLARRTVAVSHWKLAAMIYGVRREPAYALVRNESPATLWTAARRGRTVADSPRRRIAVNL
jgi:hypothetical protein